MKRTAIAALLGFAITTTCAQQRSSNPFDAPIEANRDVIVVNFIDFARIPGPDDETAPRLMHMTAETGTQRLFVSDMRGVLYSVSYDGQTVVPYLDLNAGDWGTRVMAAGNERGIQSFAFHPGFSQSGTAGYGKFYIWFDAPTGGTVDFESGGERRTHDTVLLEWSAANPAAERYDGAPPRELFRASQPFPNHNGGEIAFNPLVQPGDEDYGLLYVGLADGGSGGDPLNSGQTLSSAFGKILRIDPLGNNSTNGKYGIPVSNPFVNDADDRTLGEIYAYGVRNPQRFGWDSATSQMLLADIGQNQIEEITPIVAGGNLGWNHWEGSYRFASGQVNLADPRSEPGLVWPLVEYDHADPLLQRQVSITGVAVFRDAAIPQLQNKIVFADIPSGEIFYVDADAQLNGGQDAIRRVLLNEGGNSKTLLELIRAENASSRRDQASRADLRFGFGPRRELFLLNKADGIIRLLVPDGQTSPRL